MIATIDKAGRLVIPKPIREAMGLQPGVQLDISYVDGKIEVEYAPVQAEVRITDGFPVIHLSTDTEAPTLTDEMIRETEEAIDREREARFV